ncbi:MAG: fasciclin domain-containing protein [Pseudobacteriovorax sp.]|nr:fasciclin domain-containing protein [Pseudobacteriovorax sp.]
MKVKMLSSLVVSGLLLAACGSDSNDSQPQERAVQLNADQVGSSLVETIVADERFSILEELVIEAGLADTLSSGAFTVFAPTNEAFQKLGADTLAAVKADKELLTSILTYHVLVGKSLATDVLASESFDTVNGKSLAVSLRDGLPFINDSKILETDIVAQDSVVHVIDSVLLPPADSNTIVDIAIGNEDFSTLVDLVVKADLADVLASEGPFTVFAPTNEAFAKLPADVLATVQADKELLKKILLYHVAAGKLLAGDVVGSEKIITANDLKIKVRMEDGQVFLNDSLLIATDIKADNGVIHVIDTVLIPQEEEEPAPKTLLETAAAAGNFNTLIAAVEAAGLTDLLNQEGPFTILAPTDDAFAAIPEDQLSAILADKEILTNILTYHVIPNAAVAAETVVTLSEATMANGDTVAISVSEDGLKINQANVIATDITASNGIIHVIDSVLVPEVDEPAPKTLLEVAAAAGNFTTLIAAVEAAGLTDVLNQEGPFTILAPTDEAFAKIPANQLSAILADKHLLTNILTYHVIGAEVNKAKISKLFKAKMLNGQKIRIKRTKSGLKVNNAKVIATDIAGDNGLIHVIDNVLIPH